MIKILKFIENAYSGRQVTNNKFNVIFNYNSRKAENGTKTYSRFMFPALDAQYQPYELTHETLRNLLSSIEVVDNYPIIDSQDIDSYIISNSIDKALIHKLDYRLVKDYLVTREGDYTGLGLLAVLLRCHYNDMIFKDKVESDLVSKMNYSKVEIVVGESTREYFVHPELSRLEEINSLIENRTFNKLPYIFSWKN